MKVEMFRTSYVHISELSQEEMKDLSTAMDLLIRHKVIQQSTLSVTDASPEKTREDRRTHAK